MTTATSSVFPALLKYWRKSRGLSQLDFSLAADVSARHISFLETGRAQPSRGMILRLANVLDIPLADQNTMLREAGFEEIYQESAPEALWQTILGKTIERMMKHHEPYPMAVFDHKYDLIQSNRSAVWMLQTFCAHPETIGSKPLNGFEILFDDNYLKPFLVNWQTVAQALLSRLQREVLHNPRNIELAQLLERLKQQPGVVANIDSIDWSQPSEAVFRFELRRDNLRLAFFGSVTTFSAPQNITAEGIKIESYFPADEESEALLRKAAEN